MKFKRNAKLEQGLNQIDIVPFVNVVFLLLILILLSSLFLLQPEIKIQLPKTVPSEVIREENAIITITSEDVMYLNGTVTTLTELRKNLGKDNKDKTILIKSDRKASLGRIIDVWDLCRDLGIEKVNIATDQKK